MLTSTLNKAYQAIVIIKKAIVTGQYAYLSHFEESIVK